MPPQSYKLQMLQAWVAHDPCLRGGWVEEAPVLTVVAPHSCLSEEGVKRHEQGLGQSWGRDVEWEIQLGAVWEGSASPSLL